MIKEFKEFISRGNMVDMAVGIIIGAAFTAIVTSLVDDIIMPLISILTGNIDFTSLFVALDGNDYASLAAAEEAGAAVFKYGSFISAVINFILVALVVFLLVKGINNMRARAEKLAGKEKAEEAPTTKECPYCLSEIPLAATKCAHCASLLELPAEEVK